MSVNTFNNTLLFKEITNCSYNSAFAIVNKNHRVRGQNLIGMI